MSARAWWVVAAVAVVAAIVTALALHRPGPDETAAGPAPAGDPTAELFGDASAASAPSCRPETARARIGGEVSVVVMRGTGVSGADVRRITRGLAAFYEPYGLRFAAAGPVQAVDTEAVLAGSRAQVRREIEGAGNGDAQQLVSDAVLAPLRAFMQRHAVPARDAVLLVVLPRIAEIDSVARQQLPELRGLTFSPRLAGPVDEAGAGPELAAWLDLPDAFTPTVFVSLEDVRHARGHDETAAHELGHALGLPHSADPDNLMAQAIRSCVPVLDAEQVARIRRAVSSGPGRPDAAPAGP